MSLFANHEDTNGSDKIAFQRKDLVHVTLFIALITFFVLGIRGGLEPFQFTSDQVTTLEERVSFLEHENELLRERRNELLAELDVLEGERQEWQRYE